MTTYNNFLAKQPAGLIEETALGIDKLPFRFTGKELDEETGLYYYGARYLDPKYSRWLSGDPVLNEYIPQAPVNDEAKKLNENLPGMGGVFNVVNLHVYHYAGNNPIKYTYPGGRSETIHTDEGRQIHKAIFEIYRAANVPDIVTGNTTSNSRCRSCVSSFSSSVCCCTINIGEC